MTVVFEDRSEEDNVEGNEFPVTVAFEGERPVEVVPRLGEGLLTEQPVLYLENP